MSVTYTLQEDNAIRIDYDGVSDKKTVINVTNHSYFNLAGHDSGSIHDERVMIKADGFTEILPGAIPTGRTLPVEGTPMDPVSYTHLDVYKRQEKHYGLLLKSKNPDYPDLKMLSLIHIYMCIRDSNESQPIVDARLENGDRVHVVLPPVAVNGPIITIRRFPKEPMTMKRLLEMDSISQEEIDFLADAVRAGYSILVAGGTGSGKTTFLNALSEFIPEEERVVVIEDTAELQIQHVPNLVRLETCLLYTSRCV